MTTILITGVNGFVGQHMARELHQTGYKVVGLGLEETPHERLKNLLDDYISCDLTDQTAVDRMKSQLKEMTAIIHLAGIATTNNSPEVAAAVLRINVEAHRALYATLASFGSTARVIAVSTGLAYDSAQSMPLLETSKLLPDVDETNPYIRSKLRVEALAEEYRANGLDIITVRPFNHIGPYQGLGFFVPDKVSQIKNALKNGESMTAADAYNFWRDFTDVRDVVKAYRLLAVANASTLTVSTYNVASGTAVYGRDLFQIIAKELGFTNYTIIDDAPLPDSPRITGDAQHLQQDTGWKPAVSLVQTIHDYALSATE